MVSQACDDAVDTVRQGLTGHSPADEQTLASATILAERLGRINQLGGLFEQVSFSPQMQALMSRQFAAAGYAV